MGLAKDHCGSPISSPNNYICSSHCFVQLFFSDVQMCTIPTAEVSCIRNSAPLVIHWQCFSANDAPIVWFQLIGCQCISIGGADRKCCSLFRLSIRQSWKKKVFDFEKSWKVLVCLLCALNRRPGFLCNPEQIIQCFSWNTWGWAALYTPWVHWLCILLLAFSKIPFSKTSGRSSCLTDLALEPHTAELPFSQQHSYPICSPL